MHRELFKIWVFDKKLKRWQKRTDDRNSIAFKENFFHAVSSHWYNCRHKPSFRRNFFLLQPTEKNTNIYSSSSPYSILRERLILIPISRKSFFEVNHSFPQHKIFPESVLKVKFVSTILRVIRKLNNDLLLLTWVISSSSTSYREFQNIFDLSNFRNSVQKLLIYAADEAQNFS